MKSRENLLVVSNLSLYKSKGADMKEHKRFEMAFNCFSSHPITINIDYIQHSVPESRNRQSDIK